MVHLLYSCNNLGYDLAAGQNYYLKLHIYIFIMCLALGIFLFLYSLIFPYDNCLCKTSPLLF